MAHTRTDAIANGAFLDQELRHVLARTYDRPYADIPYKNIIPVSTEVDPGATEFKYDIWDRVGDFDLIGDMADDLPTSDVKRGEVVNEVRAFGGSFVYTDDEILHAQMAKKPLDQKKADACTEAYERRANLTALFGRAGTSLRGLLNHPAVDVTTVTGNASDGWFDAASVTPQQMLDLLNFGVTAVTNNSRMVEKCTDVLMPYSDWRTASTTCRSSTDSTTVLELFMKMNPQIKSVTPINELDPANSSGILSAKRMVFYSKDPEKVEFHITMPLTFKPPQPKNLSWKVPAWAKFGGTIVPFPKSMLYVVKG